MRRLKLLPDLLHFADVNPCALSLSRFTFGPCVQQNSLRWTCRLRYQRRTHVARQDACVIGRSFPMTVSYGSSAIVKAKCFRYLNDSFGISFSSICQVHIVHKCINVQIEINLKNICSAGSRSEPKHLNVSVISINSHINMF